MYSSFVLSFALLKRLPRQYYICKILKVHVYIIMKMDLTDKCDVKFPKEEMSGSSQDSYSSTKAERTRTRLTDVFGCIINTKMNAFVFLQNHGAIPRTKSCPGPLIKGKRYGNCGHEMMLKSVKDRKDSITWRCRRVHKVVQNGNVKVMKDVKVTVREGTWLEKVNLTVEEIILLMYCWANYFDNQQIQHEVGCSDKTVTNWCHFLRQSCMSHVLDYSEPIGGPGIEVEIDESKFGKRKYYKGHHVEGQWIFGGREKLNKKKVFMVPVPDRSKDTLLKFIKTHIKSGSIIHSDCWSSYKELSKMGYEHLTVNHSKNFKDPKTGACTNKIESDWRHAKVSMPRYGVKQGDHASYLAEFMWRRKFHDHDLFIEIITQLSYQYKMEYFKNSP